MQVSVCLAPDPRAPQMLPCVVHNAVVEFMKGVFMPVGACVAAQVWREAPVLGGAARLWAAARGGEQAEDSSS